MIAGYGFSYRKNMENRYTEEAIDLLRQMILIPSPSFEEEAVSCHISRWLTDKGITHNRVRNNIIAVNSHFCPSKRTLMLCAHIDTVLPSPDYSFDPYRPDYAALGAEAPSFSEDNVVLGLGANDDGASVVSMTAAFRHYYDKDMPVNLMLVLSTEEEKSGADGMRFLWKDNFIRIDRNGKEEKVPAPEWAIIGEPTGMRAATSERGLLVIDGEAHGISGHAARGDGQNALYIALDDIDRLRNHVFGRISERMGKVALNVTQINAGTAHNVIPDHCSFVVDIRPTELYTNGEILDELQAICRSTLKARNLANRSSATRDGSPLLECAGLLGIGTFSSPTTSDWMRIGCDAIKMGPGMSERSHRKDEFVYIKEIEDGIRQYTDYIGTFIKIQK